MCISHRARKGHSLSCFSHYVFLYHLCLTLKKTESVTYCHSSSCLGFLNVTAIPWKCLFRKQDNSLFRSLLLQHLDSCPLTHWWFLLFFAVLLWFFWGVGVFCLFVLAFCFVWFVVFFGFVCVCGLYFFFLSLGFMIQNIYSKEVIVMAVKTDPSLVPLSFY